MADGATAALSIKVVPANAAATLNDLIASTLLKDNKIPIVVCDSSGGNQGLNAQDMLAMAAQTAGGDPDFRIQQADRGRVIESSTGSFRSRVLFLEGDPRAPEVYEFTLRPGAEEEAAAHADDTFEHITMLRGTLTVSCDGKKATLRSGDTLFFRADLAHSYHNPEEEDAVAHLVMSYRPS